MTLERQEELWRRFLDEGLDAREEMELWRALETDTNLREQVLRDYAMDSQLRSWHQIDQSTNEFVLQVMSRLPFEPQVAAPPVVEEAAVPAPPAKEIAPPVAQPRQFRSSVPSRMSSTKAGGVNWYVVAGTMGAVAAGLLVILVLALPKDRQSTVHQDQRDGVPTEDNKGAGRIPETSGERDHRPGNHINPLGTVTDVETRPDAFMGDGEAGIAQGEEPIYGQRAPQPDRDKPAAQLAEQRPPEELIPGTAKEPSPVPNHGLSRPPILSPSEVSKPVAVLVRENNATWQQRPAALAAAQPLTLLSGDAELAMLDGAQVIVKAPATFELTSAKQVRLASGRLQAVVPPKAVGFTVETPSSQIVDLGTEFEVTVDDQGATGVHVQKGEVELTTKPVADQELQQWKLSSGQSKWLTADGKDFDWVLTLRVDRLGTGVIEVEGRRMEYVGNSSQARTWMLQEFAALSRKLPTRSNPRKTFRAMIDVNGQCIEISTREELQLAQQEILRQFSTLDDTFERMRQMQQKLPNAFQVFDFEEMQRRMQQLQQHATERPNP